MLENNSPRITYLHLMNGKIVHRVQPGTPDAIERTNKLGNVVSEKHYSAISGFIEKITKQENTFGIDWMLFISDGDNNYCLQFPYSGSYAGSFFRALPNVDPSLMVRIAPYTKRRIVDGVEKVRSSLYINQGNTSVKWFYTKESPGDLPSMKLIKFKGGEQWDDSDQLLFFENIAEKFNQLIDEKKNTRVIPSSQDSIIQDEVGGDEPSELTNDLPF